MIRILHSTGFEAGVDIAVVSKQLGHSSPTVTWNTYQHVRKDMKGDAATRVAAAVLGRRNTQA